METFEALRDQVSKITIYDIKSMYNQAKNMVLNVSEMEAKVQEATNDEPWGASSTLMQEIAQGTFNFQHFNEIMPSIYSRFMDKEAREWRQIYKALQLLEYIIKHGSERVVDDARSHVSTLKMLRSFHYIDEKGKDQGINVRNRAKEIVELLSDLDRVRQERRKAKANRNKYIGTGNDSMNFSSSGGRYGGFGSDSYDYGGGYGGSSGGGSSGFRDSSRKQDFEEYDAGDWEDAPRRSTPASQQAGGSGSSHTATTSQPTPKPTPAPVTKAPEPAKTVNLLDFDDESFGAPMSAPAPAPVTAVPSAPKAAASNDFDDFDDFQSAPSPTAATPVPPIMAAAVPVTAAKPATNVFDLLNATPAPTTAPSASAPRPPMGYGMGIKPSPAPVAPMKPANPTVMAPQKTTSTGSTSTGGGFDELWTMSLGGSKPSTPAGGTAGKTIQDLQKEKASQAFWGSNTGGAGSAQQKPSGAGAFGGFATSGGGGADDLLL